MKSTLKKLIVGAVGLSVVLGSISFTNLNFKKAIEAVFCSEGGGGLDW